MENRNRQLKIILLILSLSVAIIIFLAHDILFIGFSHVITRCQSTISSISPNIPINSITILSSCFLLVVLVSLFLFLIRFLRLMTVIIMAKSSQNNPVLMQQLEKKLQLKNKLILLNSKSMFAFCFGFFKQRIYVSKGLLKAFTKKEVEIVLYHEKFHLENNHFIIRFLAHLSKSLNPLVPIVSDYVEHMEAEQEKQADRYAYMKCKSRNLLASIFRKILVSSTYNFAFLPSFNYFNLLESRILALKDNNEKIHLKYQSILTSVLFFIILSFIVLFHVYQGVSLSEASSSETISSPTITCDNFIISMPSQNMLVE